MKYIITSIILLGYTSCRAQTNTPSAGLVELRLEFYDTTGNQRSNPNMTLVQKIWYEDSFAIEELIAMNFVTDTNNITTTSYILEGYRLNDFRKKTIHTFKTFSDTAKIIETYPFSDKTHTTGGWGFNEKKEFKYIQRSIPLTDTIEKNVTLKRLQLEREGRLAAYLSTLYFNCNAPAFFDMDPKFSQQVGCPCTGIFNYTPDKSNPPHISIFNFLRSHLLPEEKAIFTAWRKKIQ